MLLLEESLLILAVYILLDFGEVTKLIEFMFSLLSFRFHGLRLHCVKVGFVSLFEKICFGFPDGIIVPS